MKSTLRLPWMMALLAMLAASLLLLESTKTPVEKDAAPIMREAAARAQACFAELKDERQRRGLLIHTADDPNKTGLIGDPYTGITTTLGSLESKRSVTNPNLAAAVVDLFVALELKPGDRVAANLSGSFPGANIAVLCAMDAMGLEGVALPSVGSSTYGANLPSFTYLDMEAHLVAEGLLKARSAAFSMGGETDLGLEFAQSLREEICERLEELGYERLAYADLEENVRERVRRFERGGMVRCLINVGGNLPSFGNDSSMTTLPGGMLTALPGGGSGTGLVQHYLRAGVPVLNLLNMKALMTDLGLPYDPVPLPAVGEGGIYWRIEYRRWLVALVCAADLVALSGAVVLGRKKES